MEARGERYDRRDIRAALLLTLLAALLRFPTLGLQSFDRDEAFTVGAVVQPSLLDTLGTVSSETSPPTFYVLVWICSKLFGTGEVGMRLVSAVAGTATAPVAFELGRRLVSRRVGVVIGLLVAVNPLLFWYSQDARPYALLVLASTLSLLFLVMALEAPSRPRLAGWVAACALAFSTHWFAGFLIAAEAVWLLVRCRDRRSAALAVLGAAVAMGVLLPLLVHQARYGGGYWIAGIELGERLGDAAKQFLAGVMAEQLAPAALVAGALVAMGLVLLALRADANERRGGLAALALGGAAVLLPLAIAMVGPDFVIDKNLLPALVPLGLAAAAGLGARRAGKAGLAATAGLVALGLGAVAAVTFDRDLQRSDWRGAVDAMGAAEGPRAIVVPYNGDASAELYLDRERKLTGGDAQVSEVVVFGWPDERSVELPAGFRRVEHRSLTHFEMLRFRADRALTVSRRRLAITDIGGGCNPDRAVEGCEQGKVLVSGAADGGP